jgi:hypothetical protein
MKIPSWISPLFLFSALYDGVLGVLFALFPAYPYQLFDVPPPNHMGYVRFPACLLVIFGLMFLQLARDPARYRHLIPYGILLKLSYCGVTLAYWIKRGIPGMWKPFTFIDFVMGLLFVWAYVILGRPAASEPGLREGARP